MLSSHSLFLLYLFCLPCPTDSGLLDWITEKTAEIQATVSNWLNETYSKWKGEDSSWKCGSVRVPLSQFVSKLWTRKKCPDGYDQVNQACISHDECYSNLLGQSHCDFVFCSSLEALQSNCSFLQGFCEAVKKFGHVAYREKKLRHAMRTIRP